MALHRLFSIFTLAICVTSASAADVNVAVPGTRPAAESAAAAMKTETLAPRISKFTFNPDGTILAIFDTKDKQGNTVPRECLITPDTIVNVNGTLKKSSDIKDEMKKDVVAAMVGPDGKTCILLRWGRVMLNATESDLTPKQMATLKAAAPVATAASDEAIDKRVDAWIGQFYLNAPEREARLKNALRAYLRAVRDSHNAWIKPNKSVHDDLNRALATDLSPAQINILKDLITGNQVARHMVAYHVIVPGLTKEEDAALLDLMYQAREEALDEKNVKDMVGRFQPYKDKAEAYLISKGHDWHALYSQNSKKVGEVQKIAVPAPAD